MNKKYYAYIDLYNSTMKHSIVGNDQLKRNEMIELVKSFTKSRGLKCDTKTKKLFQEDKEVGCYSITSKTY